MWDALERVVEAPRPVGLLGAAEEHVEVDLRARRESLVEREPVRGRDLGEDDDARRAGGVRGHGVYCCRVLSGPARRPRLLVLNQYYAPGVEATAHLLGELCADLAESFDLTVVTGLVRGSATPAGRSVENGVEVIRVRSTTYDRRKLASRGVNYATYLFQSVRAAFTVRKPDIVLCMTDPPIIADVALIVARRFGVPLVVVSQDVFPEIAVHLKRLENPLVVGLLRALIAAYLRRADRVVAIGETMRERLIEKGARPIASA